MFQSKCSNMSILLNFTEPIMGCVGESVFQTKLTQAEKMSKYKNIPFNSLPRDFIPIKRFSTMSIRPTPCFPLRGGQRDRKRFKGHTHTFL